MMMNGKLLKSLDELMRNFSIDDLVAGYYSGELLFFFCKIGEMEKAEAIKSIQNNAFLLVKLYSVLGIEPELTEEEIRSRFS